MYKVIIADDELYARDFLKKCIKDLFDSFEVCATMENGEQVIEYLKTNTVDLILTDVKMPKKNGLDVAKYVYENMPEAYTVIVSGYDDFNYAKQAIQYGVYYYLVKVIDIDELKNVMASVKKQLDAKKRDKINIKLFNKEMFFYDLIFHNFSDLLEAKTVFDSLDMGMEFENSVCDILNIELEGVEDFLVNKWHYDLDIFKYTIINTIQLIYKRFVMFSKFSNKDCSIIILRDKKDAVVDENILRQEIQEIFGLGIKILSKSSKTAYELFSERNDNLCDEKEKNKIDNVHEVDLHEEKKNDCIERVEEYIKINFADNITRVGIADYVHLNEDYLGKIFKEKKDMTISEYILSVRMEKAMEMLKSGIKTEEVCIAVGYTDVRNFRRLFYKYTGKKISDYRKEL